MHKNQNGFSTPHVLLALVLVAVIGLAGYKVYDSQKKTSEPAQNSSHANETVKPDKKEEPKVEEKLSDNWLLRESEEASIRVPDGFEILTREESEINFSLPGTPTYKQGEMAKVVGEPHKHFELGVIVALNNQGWNERGTETAQLKTYSGLDVKVRQFEQTEEPDGLDFAKGTKLIQYKVINGDYYMSIDYAYQGEGIVDIIEEMVKTATIE